jgi:hypothetical protein
MSHASDIRIKEGDENAMEGWAEQTRLAIGCSTTTLGKVHQAGKGMAAGNGDLASLARTADPVNSSFVCGLHCRPPPHGLATSPTHPRDPPFSTPATLDS